MKKKAIFLIALLLAGMVFVSGCAEQNPIKSSEDAVNTVNDVATNIENVQSTLQDIDTGLG